MLYSVTGATGLLGNNLVRQLLDAGHQVRVAVRSSSSLRSLQGLDIQIATGNLSDSAFCRQLMDRADGLFHSAGFIWFGSTKRQESMDVNVDATCLLAAECAAIGKRVIFVSTADALAAAKSADQPANESETEPAKGDSSYVASKRAAERRLLSMSESEKLDVVIVNPGLLLGPNDWGPSTGQMILAVTDGFMAPPLSPAGGISVADVRNVADGMIVAMQKAQTGHRYILAGENLTYLQFWKKIAKLVGRKGPLARMGRPMQRVVGFAGDMFGKVTGKETNVNSAAIRLSANWNYYDSSKAIAELDYELGDTETALRDAWQWLVANGYSKKHKSN